MICYYFLNADLLDDTYVYTINTNVCLKALISETNGSNLIEFWIKIDELSNLKNNTFEFDSSFAEEDFRLFSID